MDRSKAASQMLIRRYQLDQTAPASSTVLPEPTDALYTPVSMSQLQNAQAQTLCVSIILKVPAGAMCNSYCTSSIKARLAGYPGKYATVLARPQCPASHLC